MNKLEQLPEITDSLLSGLRADDVLKHRILQKAVETPSSAPRSSSRRPLFALLSLSLTMIALFVALGTLHPVSVDSQVSAVSAASQDSFSDQMHTITAGIRRASSPISLGVIINETLSEEEDAEPTAEPLPADVENYTTDCQ